MLLFILEDSDVWTALAPLHWFQTGRGASPAEFITTKVFAKYRRSIAVRELEEVIYVTLQLMKLLGPFTNVQVKVKGKVFPVHAMKAQGK